MTTQTLKNWDISNLGDAVDIIDGDRGKNYPKQDEFLDSGYCLFLNTKNVPSNSFSFGEKMFITKEKDSALRKGKLTRGDFVLTTRGTVGNFAYFSDKVPFENIRINSGMVILRPKKDGRVFSGFFKFYLGSPLFRDQVKSRSSGSAQPQLPIRDLSTFEIEIPELGIQKRVADVLSTYDDLIENNTRRIQILEQIAQATYTEWFVNFRFPGHEKVKMIDSGTDFGKIPEGWEIKKIKDFGSVITGKTPSKSDPSNFGSDIPFIKTPDLHGKIFCIETSESLSVKGANTQKNKTLPPKTLVVSCIGTLGVVGITSSEAQTNQQINAVILADQKYLEYLYFVLVNLKQELKNLGANGATMGNVNKDKFENIKMLFPSQKVISEYHSTVGLNFDGILNLQMQNKNLRQTRDLFLPKLITGEINI